MGQSDNFVNPLLCYLTWHTILWMGLFVCVGGGGLLLGSCHWDRLRRWDGRENRGTTAAEKWKFPFSLDGDLHGQGTSGYNTLQYGAGPHRVNDELLMMRHFGAENVIRGSASPPPPSSVSQVIKPINIVGGGVSWGNHLGTKILVQRR